MSTQPSRTSPDVANVLSCTLLVETGSEDTFREMLRIKRSVQAAFNTEASYGSSSPDLFFC